MGVRTFGGRVYLGNTLRNTPPVLVPDRILVLTPSVVGPNTTLSVPASQQWFSGTRFGYCVVILSKTTLIFHVGMGLVLSRQGTISVPTVSISKSSSFPGENCGLIFLVLTEEYFLSPLTKMKDKKSILFTVYTSKSVELNISFTYLVS